MTFYLGGSLQAPKSEKAFILKILNHIKVLLMTFSFTLGLSVLRSITQTNTDYMKIGMGSAKALTLAGLSLLMSIQTISAQKIQFINAVDDASLNVVDVYINGNLFLEDMAVNTPSFVYDMPEGTSLNIAVAPGNSTSAADALFGIKDTVWANQHHILTLSGSKTNLDRPLGIIVDKSGWSISTDPAKVAVKWIHAATGATDLNVVVRNTGVMILGGLKYGDATPYQVMNSEEIFIDVKKVGTTDILSTYRLSLQAETGKAISVVVTGSDANATALKLFIAYGEGFSVPVDYAPVARVQYINTVCDTLDVWKNGSRFSDNAACGRAMPFKYIPAELEMNIALSPVNSINAQNPYNSYKFTFANMGFYTAITTGTTTELDMVFHPGAREAGADTASTSVLFFNSLRGKTVHVIDLENNQPLFTSVGYGSFQGYIQAAAQSHTLALADADNNTILATFTVDLTAQRGKAITLYTVQPCGTETKPNLWMAQPDGVTESFQTVAANEPVVAHDVFRVMPNPVQSDRLYLQGQSGDQDQTIRYSISDITGKRILNGMLQLVNGGTYIHLPVLPGGLYYLNIQNDHSFNQTLTFIK